MGANLHGGRHQGSVWTVVTNGEWYSDKFAGYRISEEAFYDLVDIGVETIVFVSPSRGRYTSTIDDWQEYGVWDDDEIHLRQSWMSYG